MSQSESLRRQYERLKSGEIDRRRFVHGTAALGVSASTALFLANTMNVAAQSTRPEASPAGSTASRPDVGTDDQVRGAGGALKVIQWQAPTILSPHVTAGFKDFDAAQLVVEPLMHYAENAEMIPNLITEVPTFQNRLLAEDLTSVTFVVLPGLIWSDGEPVTAEDIKFTVEWVLDEANGSVNRTTYQGIQNVEILDEQTAQVHFREPNPLWFEPFITYVTGALYPRHVLESGTEAHDAFILKPIGTGPYVVESFSPNDQVLYVANENYRHPNKPFFSRVELKGGGDGAAAARAVLQTGEYDFAWGPAVEPDVMSSFVSDDGPGRLYETVGVNVERMAFNFSDPGTEVNGQRSEVHTPHPFMTDPAVREAISTAIDRQLIADRFYGFGSIPATNVVNGDPLTDSPNTSWEYDPAKAAQILEDAGWVMGDQVREKDGVELRIIFASSVNSRRQKTQAVVKSNLEAIGIAVQLEQVDAGIFFDAAAGNDQNYMHFYWDTSLYIMPQGSPRPLAYCEQWYAGPDNVNVAQQSNGWGASNNSRWISPEYDALYEAAAVETDPDTLADLFIQMNDLVIENHVLAPLVVPSTVNAASKRLRPENLSLVNFSGIYWNIANWNLADE